MMKTSAQIAWELAGFDVSGMKNATIEELKADRTWILQHGAEQGYTFAQIEAVINGLNAAIKTIEPRKIPA